jgi:Glycosyl hydrolase family 26
MATADLKQAMLTWLRGLAGKHCAMVQHLQGQSGDLTAVDAVFKSTGRYVAGLGGNYFNDNGTDPTCVYAAQNAVLIDWWNAGGIVTMCAGTPNPSGGGQSTVTPCNAANILTPGTPENAAWIVIMTEIGQGLLQLKNAGVVLPWRPLHEPNGTWNWWGPTNFDRVQFIQLWQMWRRFNDGLGLDNLIYVFASNGGDLGLYPGDAYVDFVGFDVYTSNPAADAVTAYQLFLTPAGTYGGKPIAYTEFGPGGPNAGDPNFDASVLLAALKGPLAKCVWCEEWWERWGLDQVKNPGTLLGDPWILDRDNLGRPVDTTPPAQAGTTTPVVLTPTSGGSVTDAAGNVWTLTTGGIVEMGKVAVSGGAGTAALTAIAGVIYGQDAQTNAWWSNIAGVWNGPLTALPGQSVPPPPTTPPATTPPPPSDPSQPVQPSVTHQTLMVQIEQAQTILAAIYAALPALSP